MRRLWVCLVSICLFAACEEKGSGDSGVFVFDQGVVVPREDARAAADDAAEAVDALAADAEPASDAEEDGGVVAPEDSGTFPDADAPIDADAPGDTGVVESDTGVVQGDTGVVQGDTGVVQGDTGVAPDAAVVVDGGQTACTGTLGGVDPCTMCAEQLCCPELQTCGANLTCSNEFNGCFAPCTLSYAVSTCMTTCFGSPEGAALRQCVTQRCGTLCP